MATKKKAASRLSKAEKELLARRAAGQLKRKATLEAKKKAAAAAERNPIQEHNEKVIAHHGLDKDVHVAQPILVLDPAATTQYLKEQLTSRQELGAGTVSCGAREVAQAAPQVSALVRLHDRLENMLSRAQYTHGQLLQFQERMGGSSYAYGDQKVDGAQAGTPAPSGIINAIDALLDQIDTVANAHVDAVHKLDRLG